MTEIRQINLYSKICHTKQGQVIRNKRSTEFKCVMVGFLMSFVFGDVFYCHFLWLFIISGSVACVHFSGSVGVLRHQFSYKVWPSLPYKWDSEYIIDVGKLVLLKGFRVTCSFTSSKPSILFHLQVIRLLIYLQEIPE